MPSLPDEAAESEKDTVASVVRGDHALPNAFHKMDGLRDAIKHVYATDPLFGKVLVDPSKHRQYTVVNGLITMVNQAGEKAVCIPSGKLGDKSLQGVVIEQAHKAVGHFGAQKTAEYIQRFYWWPGINTIIEGYCRSCVTCVRAKTSNQKPSGLLHSLPIPYQPWESVGMDFIGPFLETEDKNYLWVVIC